MLAALLADKALQHLIGNYLYVEEWVLFLTIYPFSWRRTATLRTALANDYHILQVWHADRRERLYEETLHELPEFRQLPCPEDWFD